MPQFAKGIIENYYLRRYIILFQERKLLNKSQVIHNFVYFPLSFICCMLGYYSSCFFSEPNVATTKVAVTTEPKATTKAGIKTTQVTEVTTLTPVSTTPAVTTVVPVTTTPSPTTKTVLTTGIRY